MELSTIILRLAGLDYDDLRDLRDVLDYNRFDRDLAAARSQKSAAKTKHEAKTAEHDVKAKRTRRNRVALRRRGLARGMDDLLANPPELAAAGLDLATDDLDALRAAVNGLLDAKRPRAGRRSTDGGLLAEGSWQVKTRELLARGPDGLPMPATDENGQPVYDDDGKQVYQKFIGRYLYLRLYTIMPNGKRRTASIYIGSMNKQDPDIFLQRVQAGMSLEDGEEPEHPDPITRVELVEAFKRGGYDAIRDWRESVNDD